MLHSAASVLALLCALTASTAAQSGSIYTTNRRGEAVNQNVFAVANDVYLGGGPGVNQPCSSSGLPDGDYYFQVTNPSGGVLLTQDPLENRRVTVLGGKFASYSGSRRSFTAGPCDLEIIQLAPFDATPSSGNEYKVWVTPVDQLDPNGGTFGFLARNSKTDTFKVVGRGRTPDQTVIRGRKFFDFNANGVLDPDVVQEVPIAGWRFELLSDGVLEGIAFTDAAGEFEFIREQDGSTYTVREIPPPPGFIPAAGARWLPTGATERTVIADQETVRVPDFGNLSLTDEPVPGLERSKGSWTNMGMAELLACDPDWRFALEGPAGAPLCLRRPISSLDPAISIFTVSPPPAPFETAFMELGYYLVGNPANGHAAYLVSVQVAASVLNQACGPLSQFSVVGVDVSGTDELRLLSDLVENVKVLLCDPRAGQTLPGENEDLRALLLGCKNEFEQVNVGSGAVHVPTDSPSEFISPYGDLR